MLKDASGKFLPLIGPHVAVADLVPLIPPGAYRAVTVGARTYWCGALVVRVLTLGKVRLVISFQHVDLSAHYVA